MTTEVIMPQLGESVVEGTVTKWLKKEGEQIEEFDPLVEVNTDKVDTEVPSPASGTVLKHYVEEGETVEAGTLLAVIGEPGDDLPEGPPTMAQKREPEPAGDGKPAPRQAERVAEPTPTQPGRSEELGFISPVVARISAEHEVDLNQVTGTGRGGRITKKDVLAYIDRREVKPAVSPWDEPASGELFRPTEEVFGAKGEREVEKAKAGEVKPLDPVRKSIAEHMLRSKRTSPHVTTVMEADMSRVIAHREAHKEQFQRDGVKLTFTPYLIAATVRALKEVPIVNSSWGDDGIQVHKGIHIGMAVSLGERGLIVPVLKNADQMSLLGLAGAVNDLAGRARRGDLKPEEVQGGTFTITNHGVSGSLFATPIINQPQAAILGVGAIEKRAVVVERESPAGGVEDVLTFRPRAYMTLTFDHRILDGAIGDTFLSHLIGQLESWG